MNEHPELSLNPADRVAELLRRPRTIALAVLWSLTVAVGGVVTALLLTGATVIYVPMAVLVLVFLPALLGCVGLWLLIGEAASGRPGAAGFRLARVYPITAGVLAQIVAVAMFAVTLVLLFFRPALAAATDQMVAGMQEYSIGLLGMAVGAATDFVVAAAVVVAALALLAAEIVALRNMLFARWMRKLRLMVRHGELPKGYFGFTEVVSYIIGAVLALGAVPLLLREGSAVLGVWMALYGVSVFMSGLVIRRSAREFAFLHVGTESVARAEEKQRRQQAREEARAAKAAAKQAKSEAEPAIVAAEESLPAEAAAAAEESGPAEEPIPAVESAEAEPVVAEPTAEEPPTDEPAAAEPVEVAESEPEASEPSETNE